MRRPAKLAVTAVAIYVSLSLLAAIVMVQLTLHPWRLPLPPKARIAAMYAPYGADLQPVVIQAADNVELHAWYSVPEHQNGQAIILLHGIGDNRGGVAGYGQAVPPPRLSHSVARFASSRRVGRLGCNLRPTRRRRHSPVG